jgi:hypothetical protein
MHFVKHLWSRSFEGEKNTLRVSERERGREIKIEWGGGVREAWNMELEGDPRLGKVMPMGKKSFSMMLTCEEWSPTD